jgi:hypothetical protein
MEANLGSHFIWWVGVVEDRQDPLKVGRCRVRILGSHTEMKSLIPTEDLPWALPMIPLNDSSSLQIKEGDYVTGFYLDGLDEHAPIIWGILPGIPKVLPPVSSGFADPRTDLSGAPSLPGSSPTRYPARIGEPTFSRLASSLKISETPIESKKLGVAVAVPTAAPGEWSEPPTPYATVYPYNRVMETESGHILEFDDTPGAERVHIYHRSGTFDEVHPDGTKVLHIKADAYEIVLSDKNVYVKGTVNITAAGDINLKAGQSVNIEAGLDIVLNATGSVISQAGLLQSHTSAGPMELTGIPMNLNGPPGAILPPPLPVVVV